MDYRLVVRDVETLQIQQLFSCQDAIQYIEVILLLDLHINKLPKLPLGFNLNPKQAFDEERFLGLFVYSYFFSQEFMRGTSR